MITQKDLYGDDGSVAFAIKYVVGELDTDKRRLVAEGLKRWLAHGTRKKVRPDLPELISLFCKRIDTLSESIEIQVVNDVPVIKASGMGIDTLRAIERGTNWFDPCDDVVSVVISSLWRS